MAIPPAKAPANEVVKEELAELLVSSHQGDNRATNTVLIKAKSVTYEPLDEIGGRGVDWSRRVILKPKADENG